MSPSSKRWHRSSWNVSCTIKITWPFTGVSADLAGRSIDLAVSSVGIGGFIWIHSQILQTVVRVYELRVCVCVCLCQISGHLRQVAAPATTTIVFCLTVRVRVITIMWCCVLLLCANAPYKWIFNVYTRVCGTIMTYAACRGAFVLLNKQSYQFIFVFFFTSLVFSTSLCMHIVLGENLFSSWTCDVGRGDVELVCSCLLSLHVSWCVDWQSFAICKFCMCKIAIINYVTVTEWGKRNQMVLCKRKINRWKIDSHNNAREYPISLQKGNLQMQVSYEKAKIVWLPAVALVLWNEHLARWKLQNNKLSCNFMWKEKCSRQYL